MTLDGRYHLIALAPILLLAFATGAAGLNADPIWTDELYSLSNIGAFAPPYSPGQIIASLADHSPQHTPLYFLLAGGWAQLAGWTQFALRALATFAGALLVAWIYRLAADLFGRRVGVVAAYLMATAVFPLVFFHEIRMYSLLLMLGAMHTCLYWRLAHRPRPGKLTWYLFVLTACALLYTHTFSTLLFAVLGCYHLLLTPKTRQNVRVLLAWLAGALLFLPYLPVVYEGFLEETNKLSTVSAAFAPEELLHAFVFLASNGAAALFAVLVALVAYHFWQSRDKTALRYTAFGLLMLIATVLVNHQFQLFGQYRSRYLLLLWIPCIVLFAYGIATIRTPRLIIVLWLLLWSAAAYQFQRSGELANYVGGMIYASWYPPLQDYAHQLQGKVRPEDYLIGFTSSDYLNSERKHGKSAADYYTQALLDIDGAFVPAHLTGDELLADLAVKTDDNPYLLFAYDPLGRPGNLDEVLAEIRADYTACDIVIDSDSLFVQRYVYNLLSCDREYEPLHYDNGVRIVDQFGDYDAEANRVRIFTGWEVAQEALLHEYNVSLQIITADRRNVMQTDRHLYDDILKWYAVEFPTENLPPGEYTAAVILYDRETLRKVAGTDSANGESSSIFSILRFTVDA